MNIEQFDGEDSFIIVDDEKVLGHIANIENEKYIAIKDDGNCNACLDCAVANICVKSEYLNNVIPDKIKTICEIESNLNYHYIKLNNYGN